MTLDPAWRGPALLLPPSVETAQRPPTLDIALSGAKCRESSVYGVGQIMEALVCWVIARWRNRRNSRQSIIYAPRGYTNRRSTTKKKDRSTRKIESLTGQGWRGTVDSRWSGSTESGWTGLQIPVRSGRFCGTIWTTDWKIWVV